MKRFEITAALAAVLGTAAAFALTAPVDAQEVGSATVVPIQVTGDPAARFTMVILGDGYTAEEMPLYREHVDKHLNVLWSTEPWRSYRNYVNVYSVEIVSGESGIDCDPEVRERRTTPLSLTYRGGCENPNARGITGNGEVIREYAAMATPDFDQTLAIANTTTYGGIGGRAATTSGGNSLGPLITPHELGHSLGRLGDEYTYSARGVPGGTYDGEEPRSPHFTLLTEEEMIAQRAKWWRWLGEESLAGGPIGRYEGGQSNVEGIWRPSKHSMMISLGYALDQVGLEQMVARISAQTELIADATPNDAPVAGQGGLIWIETAHPVYHQLDITWTLDGEELDLGDHRPYLQLASPLIGPGMHEVTVTVVDPTEMVRDPDIRAETLTATRTWMVDGDLASEAPTGSVHFTGSTQTERPVGGSDVLYVETSESGDQWFDVRWWVNDSPVTVSDFASGDRAVDLGSLGLPEGTHRVRAAVDAPGMPVAAPPADRPRELTWTVDNTPPTVTYELSEAEATAQRADGSTHYLMRDQFTMGLNPTDDQPGYVVAEFRVNGDGWHHYYGWPDAPEGTPYLFTPRGTNIKELVYGSLSSEGLSPQPWEAREPGWGVHRIEYHGIDAAGNIGPASEFAVTFLPSPECTQTVTGAHAGDLVARAGGVLCLRDAEVSGGIVVDAGASLVVADSRVQGLVEARAATAVEIVGSDVQGAVGIRNTTHHLVLFGSTFGSSVTLTGNATTVTPSVSGNTITGALSCTDNTPPSSAGTPNQAGGGASGQCSGM